MTIPNKPETIFTLIIDSQEMKVWYWPDYITGLAPRAMLEFRSPHEPSRRIPVSETGYRSFFAPKDEIDAASSVEEYIRDVAQWLIAAGSRRVPNLACDSGIAPWAFIEPGVLRNGQGAEGHHDPLNGGSAHEYAGFGKSLRMPPADSPRLVCPSFPRIPAIHFRGHGCHSPEPRLGRLRKPRLAEAVASKDQPVVR